jgi:hypothetical protein
MQVVRIVELGGGAQWEGRLSVGVARWAWCVIPVVRGSQCAALTGQNQRSLWPPAESGPKRPSEETAQARRLDEDLPDCPPRADWLAERRLSAASD